MRGMSRQGGGKVLLVKKPCCSKKPKDIVDTAAGEKEFKTLVKAVKAAGLVETLKGDGPYTVFARRIRRSRNFRRDARVAAEAGE